LTGVVVGMVADWIHHYVSYGNSHPAAPAHETSKAAVRTLLFGAVGIIISALEHVLAHGIAEQPAAFLNGLFAITLLGATMALAFWDNPIRNRVFEPHIPGLWHRLLSRWERIILGAIRGALAASIIYVLYGFAVYAISKGRAPAELVRSVWGWWFLAGLGIGSSYGCGTRFAALVPVRGLLFLAVFAAAILHPGGEPDDTGFPVAAIIRSALQHALAGPDLPAGFWQTALGGERPAHGQTQHEPKESRSEKNTLSANFLYRWFDCSAQPGAENRQAGKDHLCGQLAGGLSSPFVRSWLVVLFFAVGLGCARDLETRLRPANYQSHVLYKIDQRIATGLILILAATAFVLAIR
jgi:hypothetical protein